jgi:nucleotide-binding universal stress UspA family protein
MDPEEPPEPSPFDPCRQVALEGRRRHQQRIDQARDQLHALLAQEPATRCAIDEVVDIGRAYKAILRRATEEEADLIVMGAQGTAGVELMLYGSNTQHVVCAAACPVLTVRA